MMAFDGQGSLDVDVEPQETLEEQLTLTGRKSAEHQNERSDRESKTLGTANFVDDRAQDIETHQETF